MTDDKRYAFLKDWKPCNLRIERNPHGSSYDTIEKWLLDNEDWADVLDGEREKIISSGNLWLLHVYPDTPIGFYAIAASTLDALIDKAMNGL